MGERLFKFRIALAFSISAALVGGCGKATYLFSGLQLSSSYLWYGPYSADRLAFYPYPPSTLANSFDPAVPPAPGANLSFLDFKVASSQKLAVQVGSYWDGTGFNSIGRIYSPVTLGGTGWAQPGPGVSILDGFASPTLTGIAAGFIGQSSILAVSADTSTTQSTSAVYRSGNAWSLFPGTPASVPIASMSIPQPTSTEPVNGSIMSIAADSSGKGYLAYISQSSTATYPSNGVYVQQYQAFSGWATQTPGIKIGPVATQVQMLFDGFGATAQWMNNSIQVSLSKNATANLNYGCMTNGIGNVQCWGNDSTGQLGDNDSSNTTKATPVYVASPGGGGRLQGVIQVSAGTTHACALKADGTVYCWGTDTQGELGDNCGQFGTCFTKPYPQQVTGPGTLPLLTDAVQIASGNEFSCALRSNGQVVCWGKNAAGVGQLGCGGGCPKTAYSFPQTVPGIANAIGIAAGDSHACAVTSGASTSISCWGDNTHGQLGTGAVGGFSNVPVSIVAAANYRTVTAGNFFNCALIEIVPGTVEMTCWGQDNQNQLGDNLGVDNGTPTVPVALPAGPGGAISLSAGDHHACATDGTGKVYCWGAGAVGEAGTLVGWPSGVPLATGVTAASAVAVGAFNGCAIFAAGAASQVQCWGDDSTSQVGISSASNPQTSPLDIGVARVSGVWSSTSAINSFISGNALSTGDTKSFSAAADSNGNILAVFIQKHPNLTSSSCDGTTAPPTLAGCEYRLFSAFRNASGIWSTPSQVDANYTTPLSSPIRNTLFQDSAGVQSPVISGGKDFFTPAVAYIGNGTFIVAYAVIDNSNQTSSIFARNYYVGQGWDPNITTLETGATSISGDAFRYGNEFSISSDGEANAMLLVHHVISAGSSAFTRNYGFEAFFYSLNSGWNISPLKIQSSLSCLAPLTLPPPAGYPCWTQEAQGAIFPSGEATFIFPAPDPTDATGNTNLRLYSMEYHP